jgi:putative transport protein
MQTAPRQSTLVVAVRQLQGCKYQTPQRCAPHFFGLNGDSIGDMEFFSSLPAQGLALLEHDPVLLLFTIIGIGYLIGKISVAGFSLGAVAGVLFAGLFFGYYGLRITPGAQAVGFALFIFSVGYQAGPRFFSAVRQDGLRYLALALVVATTAILVAVLAARALDLAPGMSAGLLAGGLTSSPTLAAAQEAVREGTVRLATDLSTDAVISNIASAYAITYIFGLTGLITLIKYMPRLLGLDMVEEARQQEQLHQRQLRPVNITTRCYRVENDAFTSLPLRQLRERYCERVPVLKVLRGGEVISVGAEEYLQAGDTVELVGPRDFFTAGIQTIGPEIAPERDIQATTDVAQVVVTNKAIFGHTLGELLIPQSFGLLIQHVEQMGVRVPHNDDIRLEKGDILTVLGPADRIDLFGEYAGHVERDISETDMVTFAFGIAAGVLLGMLAVEVSGIAIGLGTAGGLLASGLVIGYLRSVRPTFGRLPEAARWLLMEFGLLIFMAGVGLRAGSSIIPTLQQSGPMLIIAGVAVTTLPMAVAYLFGRTILKLNPAILMGALTGAMTSGAALSVVTKESQSSVPAIGYAGTYAFGNVLLMVAGPLILLLA